MSEAVPPQAMDLDQALQLRVPFIDYTQFEGDSDLRSRQKSLFLQDVEWAPVYDYARLTNFSATPEGDATSNSEKKRKLQEAVFTLDQAKAVGKVEPAVADLSISYNEARIKRILLIEAAQAIRTAGSAETERTARNTFDTLNIELFGEMDIPAWTGIMSTEKQHLDEFQPTTALAASIKEHLLGYFEHIPVDVAEPLLMDQELVALYQPFIKERYASILAEIPDTDDSVRYNAQQCAEIMQRTLDVGGFQNWKCEVNPDKSNPATNAEKERIYLPLNTNRTAAELEKLTLHEQEVHGRRGLNGAKYRNLPMLRTGTADYADVEEGLGVFMEMIMDGTPDNPAVKRARDRYIVAGVALGADGMAQRDARTTMDIVWRIIAVRNAENGVITHQDVKAAKDEAYKHIENAFRGTNFDAPGLIYRKLKIYYEGLLKNVEYAREIAADPQKFEEMFIGKYNHTDETERDLVLSLVTAAQN